MKIYKGSSQTNIKVFEPQPVVKHDVGKLKHAKINADKVVWVSPQPEYALPFAMLFGKVKFGLFFNDKGERQRISITSVDYKDKIDLNEKTYLYELDPDAEYIDVYGPEMISLEPVNVIGVEEFTIREVLKQYDVYVPRKWDIE